jgi:hypothetical protein
MGLLDDAIREHLDLKRRRGADPTEVARMEQEALGPVRRETAAGEPAPEPPEPAPEPHDSDGHDHEHAVELAPEDRHDPPHGDPLHEQQELGGAAAPEPHEAEPAGDAPPAHDPLDQPTTEYVLEDHHDGEEEHADGAGEDVLEETPEFLQETPEHDRLWFEQRPPRDFDFDG